MVCDIKSIVDNEIKCMNGLNVAGLHTVLVRIHPFGYANKNIKYKYNLEVKSISQLEGILKSVGKTKTLSNIILCFKVVMVVVWKLKYQALALLVLIIQ